MLWLGLSQYKSLCFRDVVIRQVEPFYSEPPVSSHHRPSLSRNRTIFEMSASSAFLTSFSRNIWRITELKYKRQIKFNQTFHHHWKTMPSLKSFSFWILNLNFWNICFYFLNKYYFLPMSAKKNEDIEQQAAFLNENSAFLSENYVLRRKI